MKKVCTSCNVERLETEFHWHYKDKGIRRTSCKFCRSKVENQRQMTPEYKRHRQNYQLKKNYGISKEEYDLKLSLQNYACALCKTPVKTKALAVDHCHASGKVRDLLL